MSIEEIAKSLFAEIKPGGGVEKAMPATDQQKATAQNKKLDPNRPDPEEVQYPGYFKEGGSL